MATPTTRPARSAFAGLGLALLALTAAGCDDTTGLSRVSFELYAAGVERPSGTPLAFDTLTGWHVELQTVQVAMGPFYLNVAPPLSGGSARLPVRPARTTRTGVLARLRAGLLPSAHADETEDHFGNGRIVAQVTSRVVVDALSPAPVRVGSGDGVSETVASAEIWLLPEDPSGKSPTLADKAVAHVEGRASKGAQSLDFAADLVIDEKTAGMQTLQQARAVPGIRCDLDLATPHPGSRVLLRIDPRPFFRTADFSVLLSGTPINGRYQAGPTDSVGRSLREGVRLWSGVYAFAWLDGN